MKRWLAVMCVVLAAGASQALAQGVLVPTDTKVPPLAVKYLRVDAAIDNQVAKTVVEQVFQNSTDRDLEAKYIFPMPADATVRDFAMWIDGKRVSGEVVEKEKAAQVYQGIVARLKDPGLLEYMGSNLFRANVYPVPKKGTIKIQIEYGQVVPMSEGLAQYTFPLRTGEKASQTLDDFAVTVRLVSKVPLKSIYSPSHKVGIQRKDDYHATIGMEVDKALLDRDFTLYYSVSDKDFGLNLMTHRVKGEPGYFMVLIAPRTEVEDAKIARKDVCLVLDVSGSMAGAKIGQAKKALSYCVGRLRKEDRFNLIAFSTDVDPMSKELLPATDENKKKAQEFIDRLEATGGTDINAALTQALAMKPDTVVFLTDGKPTVGETDAKKIVANVKEGKGRARVFVFGVDEQVNTILLDQVGEATGGAREYVTPSEDIEVKVSSFFNKASSPVLSRVSVDLTKVETADVYPREMPDLFKGEQVLLVGRYKTTGDSAVILRGEIDGEKKSFTYEGEFPEVATGSDFIEGLWARRKVGYLLDQIRLHGENKELKDEVIRLSQKHNIITPYTSYLILESKEQYGQHGIKVYDVRRLEDAAGKARSGAEGSAGPAGRPGTAPEPSAPARSMSELLSRREADEKVARELERARGTGHDGGWYSHFDRDDLRSGAATRPDLADKPVEEREAGEVLGFLYRAKKDMDAESGLRAMDLSKELQALKQSTGDEARAGRRVTSRTVAGRTMLLYHGFWIDADWTDKLERVEIKYASEAYFALLAAEPKLKDVFKLGLRLIVVLPSKVALVVAEDEGKDQLEAKEVKRLLTPAEPAKPTEPVKPGKE